MPNSQKNKTICILFALLFTTVFILCVFCPKPKFSKTERRYLASFPQLTSEAVRSVRFMQSFESYAADTFPFRDTFRSIKAQTASVLFHRQDNHGIYQTDGYLAVMEYPLQENSLDHAINRFQYICNHYLTENNNIYLSIIPDKNCFLAEESGHLHIDYPALEQNIKEKADFAEYITISDLLEKEDYYRTDTHWRQERITDVAERLAEKMGTSLFKQYQTHTLQHKFYGVYHGQAALPVKPDTLQYLSNEAINHCQVYDQEHKMPISVYNMQKAAGADPYEMFLSGPLSLLTMHNPMAQNSRKLILFRDSFGSSIAPLLISSYSQITLVDIRYIQPEFLKDFITFENCDILFLYSTLTLNHSETLK